MTLSPYERYKMLSNRHNGDVEKVHRVRVALYRSEKRNYEDDSQIISITYANAHKRKAGNGCATA